EERGKKVAATFIGIDGKPVVITSGYAMVRKKYDSDSNELEESYYDAVGKPTLERDSGIHRVVNVFDGRGKVTRKRYWGPNNEAFLHKDGNHGWDAQYDDSGVRCGRPRDPDEPGRRQWRARPAQGRAPRLGVKIRRARPSGSENLSW